MATLEHSARNTRAKAEEGRGWYAVLARSGLVAKGASYGLVGALAIKLAVGHGGKATSRQGALQALAQHTFGQVVLALLAAVLVSMFAGAVMAKRLPSPSTTRSMLLDPSFHRGITR